MTVFSYCSPRVRARRTLELLDLGVSAEDEPSPADPDVIVTDLLREWDYGIYEGLTIGAVREMRELKGLDRDRPWNIWKDGCEGGEYVTPYLALISKSENAKQVLINDCAS